ncbi:arginine--tRNA ligase [Pseudomonadales bacterium]|nr:arginine--tRNA ligase [Pseudomonadales bacterium]MDA9366740.1 arginine--tRNA ligase [Pseudomonadales bacterium]MDB9867860.1 arginine--tRNA ligase [Pseudomonadales bacterium]MDB9918011.1 arginine--tRNA ligase [Pseudomonadales bacterium]MDB9942556.1 arginine--tRNA ligase [Pseudomonadales bacterium]
MNLKLFIDQAICSALTQAGAAEAPAVIKNSQRPEFGHYQANGVMGAAKRLGLNPRVLAGTIIEALDFPAAAKVEIAGPGFINIHLSAEFIAASLTELRQDSRLGVQPRVAETIVIDYSAPNLAKEMHIGHLRSTSIGDAAARSLEFQGHHVIRANHVGDWGAQFGSLLAYMDQLDTSGVALGSELKDLEKFYMAASRLFKSDPEFAHKAREYVVRLQSGDPRCRALWQLFITESVKHCQAVYDKLNISLTPADIKAESDYNADLPVVVDELTRQGLITVSNGAKCVFLDEFTGKDGNPLPAMVQKSDGGYPYMASDIAAVRYRSQTLKTDRALYFVDARQRLHLSLLFAVARQAGYISDTQDFRHLPFGVILKEDGKPFKTRDGADVKLIEVIDEAIARAFELVSTKNPELDAEQRHEIARVVGVGAIKYAELSKNRLTDYVFDWDTMLSFEGNTAPYLQYAYTRIRSVFRRADIDPGTLRGDILIQEPLEMQLGLKLLQFSETVDAVTEDYQANILCNYLFELAGLFMSFYEACPILKAAPEVTTSRLLIADLTARVIQQGLDLLGIDTVEQM